jgi:hypothetical protein
MGTMATTERSVLHWTTMTPLQPVSAQAKFVGAAAQRTWRRQGQGIFLRHQCSRFGPKIQGTHRHWLPFSPDWLVHIIYLLVHSHSHVHYLSQLCHCASILQSTDPPLARPKELDSDDGPVEVMRLPSSPTTSLDRALVWWLWCHRITLSLERTMAEQVLLVVLEKIRVYKAMKEPSIIWIYHYHICSPRYYHHVCSPSTTHSQTSLICISLCLLPETSLFLHIRRWDPAMMRILQLPGFLMKLLPRLPLRSSAPWILVTSQPMSAPRFPDTLFYSPN